MNMGSRSASTWCKPGPQDWETPTYDLTPFIKGVNRMKKTCPVLLEEGPQTRVNPEGEPVVLLLKSRESRKGRVLAVINATAEPQAVAIPDLTELLGNAGPGLERPDPRHRPVEIAFSFGVHPAAGQDADFL